MFRTFLKGFVGEGLINETGQGEKDVLWVVRQPPPEGARGRRLRVGAPHSDGETLCATLA